MSTAIITNPFTKLTTDELNAANATIQPILTSLATGDGSTPALLGAWISLQGAFTTNLALFQKVGVNDLASWLSTTITNAVTAAQAQIATAASTGNTTAS